MGVVVGGLVQPLSWVCRWGGLCLWYHLSRCWKVWNSSLMEGTWDVTLCFEGPRLRLVHAQKWAGHDNLSQATSNTEAEGAAWLLTVALLDVSESMLSDWSKPLMDSHSLLYTSPSSLMFRDMCVVWNQLWWWYLHQGCRQMLLIRASLSPRASC